MSKSSKATVEPVRTHSGFRVSAFDPIADIRVCCDTPNVTTNYVLGGSRLTSLQTIYDEIDRALGLPIGSTPTPDWLDDLLSGGVEGIPVTAEGGVHVNLGPRDAVAEKMAQWLTEIDFGE